MDYCNQCGSPYLAQRFSSCYTYCDTCCGSGYDHYRMEPCGQCSSQSQPAPVAPAKAAEPPKPRLSVCCKAPTFESEGRLVCDRCRCTRPL